MVESRVLVVDDQKPMQILLEELFKRAGLTVKTASNGIEALEKIRDFRPQVVVMDMKMPKMDGAETSRAMLKEMPALNIIIMTAEQDEAFVQNLLQLGVKRCMAKPFDIWDMKKAVLECMNVA